MTDAFRIPPGLPKIYPTLPYIGGGKFADQLKSFQKVPISEAPLQGIPPQPHLGHGPIVSNGAPHPKYGPNFSGGRGPKQLYFGHGPVI